MKLSNNGSIELDRLANKVPDDAKNTLDYDGRTYVLRDLVEGVPGSKGGNSAVFTLHDPSGLSEDMAIKISRHYRSAGRMPPHISRRFGRFIEEIDALQKCTEAGCSYIVQFYWEGVVTISDRDFPYYVMEKAQTDLKEYILTHSKQVDDQTRVQLSYGVHKALMELHSMGYYHRDIKPDNILLFGEQIEDELGEVAPVWKIGDLGLVATRDKVNADDLGEKIGPFGWLSPEAGNKFLTEEHGLGLDCTIDDKSDVFQLGKLMWFIFQHNIPIGVVAREDMSRSFDYADDAFNAISHALQYSKARRYNMAQLGADLNGLASAYGVA